MDDDEDELFFDEDELFLFEELCLFDEEWFLFCDVRLPLWFIASLTGTQDAISSVAKTSIEIIFIFLFIKAVFLCETEFLIINIIQTFFNTIQTLFQTIFPMWNFNTKI